MIAMVPLQFVGLYRFRSQLQSVSRSRMRAFIESRIHKSEAMYISFIDFEWLVQKQRVFDSLMIHHLITINCISYENIFTILVPKVLIMLHSKPE